MSTKGWRKSTAIIRKLADEPYEFDFLQAVRLLERSVLLEKNDIPVNDTTNPVAKFVPPATEVLKFVGRQTLAFPASEIAGLKREPNSDGFNQWKMQVNIMGLTGAMGVLPYHYTELILARLKQKDETIQHFFDLFNHRLISLFFAASTKYHLPVEFERNRLHNDSKDQKDSQTSCLLSLIGLGTAGLSKRLFTSDESLIQYSGLFSQSIRTATGLQQILHSHFEIPVQIEQFIGQWQDLIDDVRTKLPDLNQPTGQNVCLGRSAMLGKRGWYAQGKIRIILGPLSHSQLEKFAPGTSTLGALNEIVRLYLGIEHDYEFIIRIKNSDIPKQIHLNKAAPPIIGWNTWLVNNTSATKHNDTTIDISVSASRLE